MLKPKLRAKIKESNMNEIWDEMKADVARLLEVSVDRVGVVCSEDEDEEKEWLYWYYRKKMPKSTLLEWNAMMAVNSDVIPKYELRIHDEHKFVSYYADGGCMFYFYVLDDTDITE
jgi:hypothetical protein